MHRRLILITGFTLLLALSCVTAFAAPVIVKDGCRGHAVMAVQRLLIAQGYLKDAADGVAGPKTVAAIKAFQQANGLEVDGICGGATFAVLSGGEEYMVVFCETGDKPVKSHCIFFEKKSGDWVIKEDIVEGNFKVYRASVNDVNEDGFDEIIIEGLDMNNSKLKTYIYQIQKNGIVLI